MWKNEYLIYLDAGDEAELQKLLNTFQQKAIECYPFYEPDIGNQLAAIAVRGPRNMFKRFKLMGAQQ